MNPDSNNGITVDTEKVFTEVNIFWDKISNKNNSIREQDKNTRQSLLSEQQIFFKRDSSKQFIYDKQYCEHYDSEIMYDEFINNPTLKDIGLLNKDQIVLKSSYIYILFNNPNFNSDTIFKLTADNELEGFTREELAVKIMQRYHLIYFLFKNYDMKKGIIKEVPTDIDINNRSDICFRPLLYETDYTINGLSYIIYDQEKDYWKFAPITNQ